MARGRGGEAKVLEGRECPKCGGPLVERSGRTGKFRGVAATIPSAGTRSRSKGCARRTSACPACGEGALHERRSRRGQAVLLLLHLAEVRLRDVGRAARRAVPELRLADPDTARRPGGAVRRRCVRSASAATGSRSRTLPQPCCRRPGSHAMGSRFAAVLMGSGSDLPTRRAPSRGSHASASPAPPESPPPTGPRKRPAPMSMTPMRAAARYSSRRPVAPPISRARRPRTTPGSPHGEVRSRGRGPARRRGRRLSHGSGVRDSGATPGAGRRSPAYSRSSAGGSRRGSF